MGLEVVETAPEVLVLEMALEVSEMAPEVSETAPEVLVLEMAPEQEVLEMAQAVASLCVYLLVFVFVLVCFQGKWVDHTSRCQVDFYSTCQ